MARDPKQIQVRAPLVTNDGTIFSRARAGLVAFVASGKPPQYGARRASASALKNVLESEVLAFLRAAFDRIRRGGHSGWGERGVLER